MMTRHDLLIERIVSWRGRNRVAHRCTLPGLLAALSRGEVMDFPRARAHQQQPWSMFLTQLAAIALHQSNVSELPHDEPVWLSHLLRLTDNAHEPWCLVVQDLCKPAFFQPPVPEDDGVSTWKVLLESPDDLDMLVTTKGHDVKTSLLSPQDPEAWTYALCTLQTMQGYPGGAGKYHRIARMNGGCGNRPRVGLSPGPTQGQRFGRDVQVLLAQRPALVERGMANAGLALVWCKAWDGTAAVPFSSLAPHFIEVCQRVRLIIEGRGLVAKRTTTSRRRCAPEIESGDVGDAWCPVDRSKSTMLTLGSRGYDYRLLVDLLFGAKFERARAQIPTDQDRDGLLLWASALVRGQSRTEGLHERLLPIPSKVRSMFRERDEGKLGHRATAWVGDAARMRTEVLLPALRLLALGEAHLPDDFDSRVDERFFGLLFDLIDQPDDSATARWQDELHKIARQEIEDAIGRAALPDARFWRKTTDAERTFFDSLRKQFPDLSERTHAHARASQEVLEDV